MEWFSSLATASIITGCVMILPIPPFMEFALLVLGLAGGYALWKGAPHRSFGTGFGLSLLPTLLFFFAWWWTEVLYDQQVIYSFYVRSKNLLHIAL